MVLFVKNGCVFVDKSSACSLFVICCYQSSNSFKCANTTWNWHYVSSWLVNESERLTNKFKKQWRKCVWENKSNLFSFKFHQESSSYFFVEIIGRNLFFIVFKLCYRSSKYLRKLVPTKWLWWNFKNSTNVRPSMAWR